MHIAQPLNPYIDMKNLGNHNKDTARFFIRSTNQYVALCTHDNLQDLGNNIHRSIKNPVDDKHQQANRERSITVLMVCSASLSSQIHDAIHRVIDALLTPDLCRRRRRWR